MAGVEADDLSGNAYKCRVTLMAPEGKGHILDGYLASLTDWVDPSRQVVDVDEKLPGEELYDTPKTLPSFPGCLVSPALSVMLFMRESGHMCVKDIQKKLKRSPWQFHHRVELQNKNAPHRAVAQQEFFKLGEDLPLFAACPVLTDHEHVRVQLYVRNFDAMVDFYRIITDTEIETSKPEFCIFELYRQNGLAIQLSLKKCQYIYPVPVRSAYISFNVKSIHEVGLITNARIESVGANVYTTTDPDGNLVVLYENDQCQQEAFTELADDWRFRNCCCPHARTVSRCETCDRIESSTGFDDRKSLKSTSDSHDSGRVSDLEPDTDKHGSDNIAKKSDLYRVAEYASNTGSANVGRSERNRNSDKNMSGSVKGKDKRKEKTTHK